MTWIGRDCDCMGESCRPPPPDQSEFMTWIGRDCDNPVATAATSFVVISEFMTWIGRDCDPLGNLGSLPTPSFIRIYDLNWKGLWQLHRDDALCRVVVIRIYDLNWKGLWPTGASPLGISGRYQNLWPELEGIVTNGSFAHICHRRSYQNLWPELEGIVTE